MKKPTLIQGVLAVAVSIAVFYGYVYVAGKAWHKATK